MLDLEENIEEIHQKREMEGTPEHLQEKVRNMLFPLSAMEAKIETEILLMVHAYQDTNTDFQKTLLGKFSIILIFFLESMQNFDPFTKIEDMQKLRSMISTLVLSDEPSQFHDLNVLLIEALEAGVPTVMVDMPEILLRMKIANELSLKDLENMFNKVCR